MEINKNRISEMVRFVEVGIGATALHYAIYYVLLNYTGHNIAYSIGYFISFLCNYIVSSRYTFHVGTSVQRFVSFGMSHLANYFIQMILLNIFIALGVSATLAPLPVYALAVPINYLTVRFALTRHGGKNDSYYLFLMAVGFAMLWLNLMDVPTLSDDMIYRFVWQGDDNGPVEPILGIGDLLRSQYAHYMFTNGRLVVHLLIQAFLAFTPPIVLQVLNTLFFVLLLHLTTSWVAPGIANPLKPNENDNSLKLTAVAVVVCLLLFVVFQGFRTAMLWGLGAINYLWTLVAVMSLLLWLRRTGNQPIGMMHLLLSPIALLAGWSHEALSLPVAAAFVAWLFTNRNRLAHKAATPYMLWFFVGTALCLLSPGIWGRAAEGVSLQSRLVSGAINCISNIRVTWILVITLIVIWWRNRPRLREHLRSNAYGYVALIVATAIVLFCGTNLERVAFFADFIAMLLLLPLLLRTRTKTKWLIAIGCAVLLVAYVPAYLVRKENSNNWHYAERQMKEPGRELIAVRQPQKGASSLMDYFREHYVNGSFTFGFYSSYMGFDPTDINMRCAARLYDKPRLVFLPEDVVLKIKGDSTAYSNYELDSNKELYVWRLTDDSPVTSLIFKLKDEDPATLMLHQRLVAYKDDEYELDDFKFEIVKVDGKPYLVFTKPTTNIYRRIENIEIIH